MENFKKHNAFHFSMISNNHNTYQGKLNETDFPDFINLCKMTQKN